MKYLLLTDIGSSSSLKTSHPNEYYHIKIEHDRLLAEAAGRHGGVPGLDRGDGAFWLFTSAYSAVSAAAEAQCALCQAGTGLEFPDGRRLRVRMVLHGGPLRGKPGGGWEGAAFDITSRVEELAHAGQVLFSGAVAAALRKRLPDGCGQTDAGRYELRGIPEPVQLWQLDHPDFWLPEGGFEPLRNPLLPPNNLPQSGLRFIGRAEELPRLLGLLRSSPPPRLVTLTAPGGYGKSTLALEACWRALPGFDDGVWHLPLEAVDKADDIALRAAQALGCKLQGADAPLEQLCRWLSRRKLLLCLDNFEQLIAGGGTAVLREIITRAAGVHLLVTSRQRLELAEEQHFPLEPIAESVELFADRAAYARPSFVLDAETRPRVETLCMLLHGVPLGIVLTAAWADSLTLDEMRAGLNELLAEDAPGLAGLAPRQRSLRASHAWGWKLLDEQQQEALRGLSVMRGGCFADAAAAVLGLSAVKVRALLAGLQRRSWLSSRPLDLATAGEQSRYDFANPALHEYALGMAGGQPSMAAEEGGQKLPLYQQSHARHFAARSAELGELLKQGGRQEEAFLSLAADKLNFEAALELGLACENPGIITDLSQGYVNYLRRTGGYDAALQLYAQCLEVEQRRGDEHGAARTLGNMGIIHERRGNYAEAMRLQLLSLEGYRRLGDEHGVSQTLGCIGLVHQSRGDYDESLRLYEQSLEVLQRLEDEPGAARTLHLIGTVHQTRGDYRAALRLYAQSVESYQRREDEHGAAAVLNNIAAVHRALGDHDAALSLYAKSLGVMQRLGNEHGAARTLHGMGNVQMGRADYAAALPLYEKSLELYQQLGDEHGMVLVLNNIANVHQSSGDYDQSLAIYKQCLGVLQRLGDEHGAAHVLHGLGKAHYHRGDYAETLRLYAQSLEIFRSLNAKSQVAEGLQHMGEVHAKRNDLESARRCLTEATVLYRECGMADQAAQLETKLAGL